MAPGIIARRARAAGLQALALTDHNSAGNAPAFAEACRETGLHAIFGMEATTAEAVHVLCLFDDLDAAMDFSGWIYCRLPDIPHRPEKMGDQVVVNAQEEVEDLPEKFLGSATDVALSDLLSEVHGRGGLFVPSHIDRGYHSLMSQLGHVPPLPYDAVEVSAMYDRRRDPARVVGRYALVANSDAHYPDQIGSRCSDIEVEGFDVPSLRAAWSRRVEAEAAGAQGSAGWRMSFRRWFPCF